MNQLGEQFDDDRRAREPAVEPDRPRIDVSDLRAKGVEAGLIGKKLDAATIEAAAQKAADGVDVQADLQGSVEYKSHLCRVFAKRTITEAVKRVKS